MYYTYKITFPGTPYYYWGYHKHSVKEYWGSPKTNKWVWTFYEPEKQILEWFDSREEALKIERQLIKPFLNDSNCLNEGCGPGFSDLACSTGGRRGGTVTAQINKLKGDDYWNSFSEMGTIASLLSRVENPEQWSEIGKKAANKRWEDPKQKEINAKSCKKVGELNKGQKWINNGVKEQRVSGGESLPEGFEWGRIYRPRNRL